MFKLVKEESLSGILGTIMNRKWRAPALYDYVCYKLLKLFGDRDGEKTFSDGEDTFTLRGISEDFSVVGIKDGADVVLAEVMLGQLYIRQKVEFDQIARKLAGE